MTWPVVAATAVAVLTAGWVRAQVFIHSVAAGQPWRTSCPHCARTLITSWYAWAWLPRSRCRHCGNRIGPHTGVVEAATGGASVPLGWAVHDPLVLTAFLVFTIPGTALAFIDLTVRRLPDRLTLPAFTAATTLLAVDAARQPRLGTITAAFAGAVGTAGVYLLLAVIADGGAGDVKLALGSGLVLGWHGFTTAFWGVMAGFAITALYAVVMVLAGRLKRGDHIAHGASMLTAALVVTIIAETA